MAGAADMLVPFATEQSSEMLVAASQYQPARIAVPPVTPKVTPSARYNLRQQQPFVSERAIRDSCVKREFPFSEFLLDLNRQGITPVRRPAVNLGAGTDFASGPQRCIEINCNHPALGNTAAEIERTLPTYTNGNVVDLRGAHLRGAMNHKP